MVYRSARNKKILINAVAVSNRYYDRLADRSEDAIDYYYAIDELTKWIGKLTGTTPDVDYVGNVGDLAEDKNYFVLGDLLAGGEDYSGLTTKTGYKIVKRDGNVFLFGKTGYSAINAVYGLLAQQFDLEFYSDNVYTCRTKKDLDYNEIEEETFNPSIDFNWACDGATIKVNENGIPNWDYQHRLGFANAWQIIGGSWHNFLELLPESEYGSLHPSWYADVADSDGNVIDGYRTLSLLDGGDEMAQIVGDKLIALISADEAGNNFKSYYQFSAPDIRGWSNSESSQAAKTKYGAYSAEYILFMNKLAKYLDTHGGFTRKIDLVLLAYNMSLEAPSKNLSELNFYQGEKSSLAVMFAPIEKNSYRALNDETVGVKYGYSNKYFLDQLQKWNLFGGEIMFWNYSEYYDNYFVPLDTLTNMQATYKVIASAGVTHLQDEGAISDYVGTDWTALKIYIKSKLAEDVNCNVEALIERFCNVYYGAGAEYMLNLLKSEQTRYKIISDTSVSDNGGKDAIGAHVVRESMAKKKYWTESEFDEWYGYIKAAVAAVEASDLSDSDREEVIKRIEMEGVAVRYMKYYIFDKYVTLQDDSKDSIEKIKSTCVDVGITRFADGAAYIRKNRLLNTWQLVDGAIENLG